MPQQQTYLSPDMAPRLAAIDVGSNSIRLVVAEPQPGGRYRVLDEERETTRLARALADGGRLDEQSIEESLAALRRFKEIAEGLHVHRVRAIATCAVREATNGEEFVQRVADEVGLSLEVISSQQEAHLAFLSVRRRIELAGKNSLLADIGGGSTELIVASGDVVEAVFATRLGAVRLAERFGGEEGLASDDFRKLQRRIDRELRRTTDGKIPPLHLLIGSGGTFTSAASIVMASRGLSALPAAGFQMSRADVRHLVDRLRKMSSRQRRDVPGLNPDRADIIVPGLAIIDRVMKRFKVNTLQVHPYGVRDGLLLSMIDQLQGRDDAGPPSADEQINRFAEKCGVQLKHAQHVATLAADIYRGLGAMFDLPRDDDRLLRAAARLQDVGYLISYDGHHKHSYHLILHSRLDMFGPEELEIVANVARYHRGAEPKSKHLNWLALSEASQQRVLPLAAVLRIAGGLDRSHNQAVHRVRVAGTPDEVQLIVEADDPPETELWAARRRAGLFEKAFGAPVTIEWSGAVEKTPATT
ncbi:MAG: Ppx/GppA family phosphatase [Planctomycetales bacterium]|nr:Ppx/GppA family phosphatase [Planctomycetales bacterium]